ncbi:aldehyde dehydrogenase family protein [Halosimplex salinum]|uniref:aldehyde dehydrogenase family protein n=1 Tax=Halosimplex salinum TaxID=1710538 RepID=UPI000F47D561|nr:aldehyde dehydrogenase family protein [Halosimplex salinum]
MAQQAPHPSEGPLSAGTDWGFQYVDGEWLERGDRDGIEVMDPSTRESIATVPAGTPEDVDAAYAAAEAAQSEWEETPPHRRASVIRSFVAALESQFGEIQSLLVAESGSAATKAKFEVMTATGVAREAASLPTRLSGEYKDSLIPGKDNQVKRVPAGVVTVVTPWNFPLSLAARAVLPALALGNAVVLKPAPATPVSGGLAIARLFEEAGLDPGLLNVVTGRDETVGDPITGHSAADVVAFTGSTEVGKRVGKRAVESLALPALELGGNAPFVVLDDADLDAAVDAGVYGTVYHSGQACISINRHLVHESLADDYVDRLVRRFEDLPVGSAHDDETVVGPLIDERQRDSVLGFVEDTVEAGAALETGGETVDLGGVTDSLVVAPTVLSDAANDMPAACNEHFGPVAPVIPFANDEEAVELANDTEYGLAAAVFGGDLGRAETVADRIDAGMVHVNDQPINEEPHVPFGGRKASGIGRYNGEAAIREFTEEKWVSVQRTRRRYPF